jgi:hypothetical protein
MDDRVGAGKISRQRVEEDVRIELLTDLCSCLPARLENQFSHQRTAYDRLDSPDSFSMTSQFRGA